MRIKFLTGSIIGWLLVGISSGIVHADGVLNAVQIKELFSDKRFEGTNHNTWKDSYNTSRSDGTMRADVISGPEWNIKWWVNDAGQHCIDHPKFGESCGEIVDAGNGVYHRMVKGIKVNTYEKFNDL